LKVITIIGTLITVIVIGFAAAVYLNAATAPVTIALPEGGAAGSSANPQNAIGAARSIVSMDKSRQQDMQNIMDKMDGTGQ
jgi:hypothetical protein